MSSVSLMIPMELDGDSLAALLDGRKTQHRVPGDRRGQGIVGVGDVLYVIEACLAWVEPSQMRSEWPVVTPGARVIFTDHPDYQNHTESYYRGMGMAEGGGWKPIRAALMPPWAARHRARVESVRTERLLDISDEDAAAELGWKLPRGDADREAMFAALKDHWDARYAGRDGMGEHRWVSNPTVVVCEIRLDRMNQAPSLIQPRLTRAARRMGGEA